MVLTQLHRKGTRVFEVDGGVDSAVGHVHDLLVQGVGPVTTVKSRLNRVGVLIWETRITNQR